MLLISAKHLSFPPFTDSHPPPAAKSGLGPAACLPRLYLICISAGIPIGARLSEARQRRIVGTEETIHRAPNRQCHCLVFFFFPLHSLLSRFAKIVTAMASVARCMRVARPSALSALRQTTAARPICRFNTARSFSVTAISMSLPSPSAEAGRPLFPQRQPILPGACP